MHHRPNSWRFPIAIGATFWLWAMVDNWFFIGPLTLGLVLIGELVQRTIAGPTTSEEEDQPLGSVPDVPTLAKALAIGIMACMLNPHHVRVWELPFELVGAEGVQVDVRLRHLLISPLSAEYRESTQLGRMMGYNLNGLAYVVLFVGGGLVLGLGAGRLRFAHLALWVGFALLSLASVNAIPFFPAVAIPVVASQLNVISARIHLKSWGDPKTRFVLVGSASGRVITLEANILVQPLETAVIQSIDVRVGQVVAKGQRLARLDATFASADASQLRTRLESLQAQISRLESELEGRPGVQPASADAKLQAPVLIGAFGIEPTRWTISSVAIWAIFCLSF
jgi:hypothetical protein